MRGCVGRRRKTEETKTDYCKWAELQDGRHWLWLGNKHRWCDTQSYVSCHREECCDVSNTRFDHTINSQFLAEWKGGRYEALCITPWCNTRRVTKTHRGKHFGVIFYDDMVHCGEPWWESQGGPGYLWSQMLLLCEIPLEICVTRCLQTIQYCPLMAPRIGIVGLHIVI